MFGGINDRMAGIPFYDFEDAKKAHAFISKFVDDIMEEGNSSNRC